MGRVVGLDVGAHHVRLVEVDGGKRGLRILRLGERALGPVPEGGDREEAVREAADALFKDTRASRGEVVLSWPAESVVLRELSVPFREDDQIRKVVKFEIESHVHASSIDDVVVDFVRTGETHEGARLLVAAAPKAPIRARLAALDKVKVDPVAVDLDLAALYEAAFACGALEDLPNGALLDIGARSTKIILVVNGRWTAARCIRGGVDGLSAAVGRDLGVEPAEAEARAMGGARPDDLLAVPGAAPAEAPAAERSASTLETALVEDRRSDFLNRLCREATRTLASAGPGITFAGALVTGRGSLVPGVRERLAEHLGLPVKTLDLLSRVEHRIPADRVEEANAVYAVALGAAARGIPGGPLAIDLRREDLAFARRFDQVKVPLTASLGLLLLGVGFLLFLAKKEKEKADAEFGKMVGALNGQMKPVEKRYAEVLGADESKWLVDRAPADPLDTVPEALKRAKRMQSHLSDELGLSTEVPAIQSCLESWKEIHRRITGVREKLDYVLVEKERYDQKDVTLEIALSVREQIDILKEALGQEPSPFGKPEDLGSAAPAKDTGKWKFKIVLPLKKGAKPK